MPHTPPLIPDIAKLVRDIDRACRKDSDGGVKVTLPELVVILKDAGIVVVDLAGVVL